jgi:CRP-like cAMP-binding protein
MVVRPWRIAKHYVFGDSGVGWFWLDLVASFPFDLFFPRHSPTWRGLKCLKLLRLQRLYRSVPMSMLLGHYAHNPALLTGGRILKIILLFYYMTHCGGCFFTQFNETIALDSYTSCAFISLQALVGENPCGDDGTEAECTVTEKWYIMVMMLCGAMMNAIFFGQVALLIQNLNRTSNRYRHMLDDVSESMAHLRLPAELRTRIRNFFDFKWHTTKCLDHDEFNDRLSAPLAREIALWTNKRLVTKVPLFEGVQPDFLTALVCKLSPRQYLPGDYIILENETGREMFFIKSGRAEVLVGGLRKVVHAFDAGDFFGEIAVMLPVRRTATVCADDYCELMVLTKAALDAVMHEYPVSAEVVRKKIDAKVRKYMKQNKKVVAAGPRSSHTPIVDVDRLNARIKQKAQDLADTARARVKSKLRRMKKRPKKPLRAAKKRAPGSGGGGGGGDAATAEFLALAARHLGVDAASVVPALTRFVLEQQAQPPPKKKASAKKKKKKKKTTTTTTTPPNSNKPRRGGGKVSKVLKPQPPRSPRSAKKRKKGGGRK